MFLNYFDFEPKDILKELLHFSGFEHITHIELIGKKGRGRKRKTLFDHWSRKENGRTETYGEIKRRAEDRDGWRVWR